jgi:hypothetical protein
MAIIIRGKSTCWLCGKLLEVGQPLTAFSAFLQRSDPHWQFSDLAMHEQCFEMCEQRDAVIHKYQVATGQIREEPGPHKTQISVLGNPDDRSALLRHHQKSD